MKTGSSNKAMTVNLIMQTEPFIDVDELECIIQQLEAIERGWGHDFGTTFVKDDELIYTWENSNGNSGTSSSASSK